MITYCPWWTFSIYCSAVLVTQTHSVSSVDSKVGTDFKKKLLLFRLLGFQMADFAGPHFNTLEIAAVSFK